MGPYFIDLEAFKHGRGKYRPVELCVLDVDQPLVPLYFTFAPTKPWDDLSMAEQRTYEYETRELHHLTYYEGDSRYCRRCVMHHVKRAFPYWQNGIFYVMDQMNGEKVRYLKEEFPELNIVHYNATFASLPQITSNITCMNRDHGPRCAYLKCMRLCHHYTHDML